MECLAQARRTVGAQSRLPDVAEHWVVPCRGLANPVSFRKAAVGPETAHITSESFHLTSGGER